MNCLAHDKDEAFPSMYMCTYIAIIESQGCVRSDKLVLLFLRQVRHVVWRSDGIGLETA